MNRLLVELFFPKQRACSQTMKDEAMALVYLSNRPHFLWVYGRDNPRVMLGEHEKISSFSSGGSADFTARQICFSPVSHLQDNIFAYGLFRLKTGFAGDKMVGKYI